ILCHVVIFSSAVLPSRASAQTVPCPDWWPNRNDECALPVYLPWQYTGVQSGQSFSDLLSAENAELAHFGHPECHANQEIDGYGCAAGGGLYCASWGGQFVALTIGYKVSPQESCPSIVGVFQQRFLKPGNVRVLCPEGFDPYWFTGTEDIPHEEFGDPPSISSA